MNPVIGVNYHTQRSSLGKSHWNSWSYQVWLAPPCRMCCVSPPLGAENNPLWHFSWPKEGSCPRTTHQTWGPYQLKLTLNHPTRGFNYLTNEFSCVPWRKIDDIAGWFLITVGLDLNPLCSVTMAHLGDQTPMTRVPVHICLVLQPPLASYLEVSRNRATPSPHPFLDGIFPHKPSIFGYPHWWKSPFCDVKKRVLIGLIGSWFRVLKVSSWLINCWLVKCVIGHLDSLVVLIESLLSF